MDIPFDRVFVINLDRSKDRWAEVSRMLASRGFDGVERVSAVDGKTLDTHEAYKSDLTSLECSMFCPKAMLAIAITHMNIWRTIVRENIGSCVIFEDDVQIQPDGKYRLAEAMEQVPDDWELLYLGCLLMCTSPPNALTSMLKRVLPTGSGERVSKNVIVPEYPTGAHAYALTLEGARKLLGLIDKARFHIDLQMAHAAPNRMRVYAIDPPIATQEQFAFVSTNTTSEAVLASYALDKIRNSENTSLAYILNLPLGRFLDYDITVWTIMYVLVVLLGSPTSNAIVAAVLASDLALGCTKPKWGHVLLLIATALRAGMKFRKRPAKKEIPRFAPSAGTFADHSIAVVHNVLDENLFSMVLQEAENIKDRRALRSADVFSTLRKAEMVPTRDLLETKYVYPLYRSGAFISALRTITGIDLRPMPDDDKAACSLLAYEQPGDHIAPHTDPSHVAGERLVVLICLANSGPNGGLSSSTFSFNDARSGKSSIRMRPNDLIVFRGSELLHWASPISHDEKRLLLSMTYCDLCTPTLLGTAIKMVKETVLGI